jgi:hypothetical protein
MRALPFKQSNISKWKVIKYASKPKLGIFITKSAFHDIRCTLLHTIVLIRTLKNKSHHQDIDVHGSVNQVVVQPSLKQKPRN